jgi:hypothetical protein
MNVRIDETGSDEAALYVHGVGGLVVPEADDITVFDGDAAVDDPPGKDVDDPGVGEEKIAGGIAPGGGYDWLKIHYVRSLRRSVTF